jgi:thiol-disulfide isomerase/thioredoxin
MKRIVYFFICFIICFAGCRTNKPVAGMNSKPLMKAENNTVVASQSVNFSDQITWLLGYFNQGQLKKEPHSEWFFKGYDAYQFNTEAMNSLAGISKDGLAIKIVMGTWCPDSRREVPRFMKVLDSWKFPADMITFVGVDNAKLSPVGDFEVLDIVRVPTFIIYKNNVEAGRIIENPVTSLEQDIVNILRGMNNNK